MLTEQCQQKVCYNASVIQCVCIQKHNFVCWNKCYTNIFLFNLLTIFVWILLQLCFLPLGLTQLIFISIKNFFTKVMSIQSIDVNVLFIFVWQFVIWQRHVLLALFPSSLLVPSNVLSIMLSIPCWVKLVFFLNKSINDSCRVTYLGWLIPSSIVTKYMHIIFVYLGIF